MNSVPAKPPLLLVTCLLAGYLAAQPQCDVLVRPAFHYTADGLTLIASDSSRTYGLVTTASWDFGDGTSLSSTGYHVYGQSGTFSVCLTLTTAENACISTFCREVVIPLTPCASILVASFSHHGSGTNANQFVDGSIGPATGSWLWEFGDGTTSQDPAPDHTWALPGPHFVSLTREADGCVSTHGRWVEVDGNGTTCGPGLFTDFLTQSYGTVATFTPTLVVSGVSPVLGIWSYGDGSIDTAMTGSHTYSAPGSYQVCFLVGAFSIANQDTCFSLVCKTIDTFSAIGMDEGFGAALVAWPNPTIGTMNLGWSGAPAWSTIRLYDMLGRPVREWQQVLRSTNSLRFDGLTDGAYLLEVTTTEGRHRQQVRIEQ